MDFTLHCVPEGHMHWSRRVITFQLSNRLAFEAKLIDAAGLYLSTGGQGRGDLHGREVSDSGIGPHPAVGLS